MVSIQKTLAFFLMSAHRSRIKIVIRWLAVFLCMSGSCYPLVGYATTYLYTDLRCGDTCIASDINNNGDVVLTDWAATDRLYTRDGYYKYIPYSSDLYTVVLGINDFGDMYGHNSNFPFIWIGGVFYDMSKPENAGITFIDSHPAHPVTIDLNALSVIGWTTTVLPADLNWVFGNLHGLENDVGEIILWITEDYRISQSTDYSVLLTPVALEVPEPSSLTLAVIALAGLIGLRRRRQTRIDSLVHNRLTSRLLLSSEP